MKHYPSITSPSILSGYGFPYIPSNAKIVNPNESMKLHYPHITNPSILSGINKCDVSIGQ